LSGENPLDGRNAPVSRRDDLRTLGLLLGATADEILKAYMKLRRALRGDSPALRSAASEQERRQLLRMVEEAYARLSPQAGQPIRFERGSVPPRPAVSALHPDHPAGPVPARGASPAEDPNLELRSRPSPFRPRRSLPL
jgi:hypothetical protein